MINTIHTTNDTHKLTVGKVELITKNGLSPRVNVDIYRIKVEKGNKHTELLQSLVMTPDEAGQLARALDKHAMPDLV